MRKILSVIASFLTLSLAVTSCLNSDNDYELSSDDTITGFELDAIYGVNYKFTIDQLAGQTIEGYSIGKIYNVDSVPFSADTIINKILIKNLYTNGYVTAGKTAEKDTFFNYTDSLDFSKTMYEPLTIRVRSADGQHIKQYEISVRIHETDPDSLVWGGKEQKAYTGTFSSGAVLANQETKTVSLGEKLFTFVLNGTAVDMYEKGAEEALWTKYTSISTSIDISSIINYNDRLFAVTSDNKVLQSLNGHTWSQVSSVDTGGNPIKATTLLTTFTNDGQNEVKTDISISGITQAVVNAETVYYFSTATVDNSGNLTWTVGKERPDDFPTNRISATKSHRTSTGMQRAVLAGKPKTANAPTIPWFSLDGLNWVPMATTDLYAIPYMERPSIIYYGKTYYAFGGDFSTMYTSVNGQVWTEVEKKFLFPSDKDSLQPIFKGRTGYSMTVDKDNYIWIVWGKNTNYTDQVWRGKLNRLGFIIQ